MELTIRRYDDHRSSAEAEGGYPYIYLCDECAEKRGADVTLVEDPNSSEELYCSDCGRPNRAAAEAQKKDAEAHFRNEPGTSRPSR